MGECKREDIREDLLGFIQTIEKFGYECKAYNKGVQINAKDKAGIIQSFYPTTGTILLHASNDRSDRRTHSIKDSDISTFLVMLGNPETIQRYFK